jgi:hypothetical protein
MSLRWARKHRPRSLLGHSRWVVGLRMASGPVLCGPAILSFASAHAAEPDAVAIEVADCRSTPEEPGGLLDALAVELAPLHLRPVWVSHNPPEVVARVLLRSQDCEHSSAPLELRIWSGHSRLIAERTIATRSVSQPVLRRTLALLVSEALGAASEAVPESTSNSDSNGDHATAPLEPAALPDARRFDATPGDALFFSTDPYPRPPYLHLGAAGEMRLAPPAGSLLLGVEFNARARIDHSADWAAEVSYASAGGWPPDERVRVRWWDAASGIDLLAARDGSIAVGPRISASYVAASTKDPSDLRIQRALIGQLGVRARLSKQLGAVAALEVLASFSHTLGVLALTEDEVLEKPLDGWLVNWGMGIAISP